MSSHAVRLLFFAAARDAAGVGEVAWPLAEQGTSVAALARAVVQRFPSLEPYLPSLRFAVNGEYAQSGDPVRPGDEVAVIPPVAGG